MAKNIVKYTERSRTVSISVEVETPVQIGNTLMFRIEDVVPSMCERVCHFLPAGVELENKKAVIEAFFTNAEISPYGDFGGRRHIIPPPYVIGNVESICVIKNESARRLEHRYHPLYTMGFDVDYGDGEMPKHYCVKAFLDFGFERVSYKANSISSFAEYRVWVERKLKEFSAQQEAWLKENPSPM